MDIERMPDIYIENLSKDWETYCFKKLRWLGVQSHHHPTVWDTSDSHCSQTYATLSADPNTLGLQFLWTQILVSPRVPSLPTSPLSQPQALHNRSLGHPMTFEVCNHPTKPTASAKDPMHPHAWVLQSVQPSCQPAASAIGLSLLDTWTFWWE